jgi:hypothetical protein
MVAGRRCPPSTSFLGEAVVSEIRAGRVSPSIEQILRAAPWVDLEEHLNELRERVDRSITLAHRRRAEYREELLANRPDLLQHIRRPSPAAVGKAERLLLTGTVAAADGTLAPVPLLAGCKIQVGVVIVFNSGRVVDLVTRVFEAELTSGAETAREFFADLRKARQVSNLLARAVMLFGERKLLLDQRSDWRMIHGELIPHELRTGAGRPTQNLQAAFELVNGYIASEQFIAVSEGKEDLDILNAAILLEPGEYIVLRSLADTLTSFLEGDEGQMRANFNNTDRDSFRRFIESAGAQVSVVLVKAGHKPFLVECHQNRVEEAMALFLADSLWTKGLPADGSGAVRGFPFHIDLADQVARTLFKGSDFQDFVDARLFALGTEAALFDLDPRRTRA